MRHLEAVVFGTGKMACGLLGPLLTESGYETVFVGRREEVVEAINRRGGYGLTVTGPILTLKYENPHALITVKGQDKTWTVTLAPTSGNVPDSMLTRIATVWPGR